MHGKTVHLVLCIVESFVASSNYYRCLSSPHCTSPQGNSTLVKHDIMAQQVNCTIHLWKAGGQGVVCAWAWHASACLGYGCLCKFYPIKSDNLLYTKRAIACKSVARAFTQDANVHCCWTATERGWRAYSTSVYTRTMCCSSSGLLYEELEQHIHFGLCSASSRAEICGKFAYALVYFLS